MVRMASHVGRRPGKRDEFVDFGAYSLVEGSWNILEHDGWYRLCVEWRQALFLVLKQMLLHIWALCNRLGGATVYDRTNSSEMAKWQEIKLQMPNGKVIDTGAPITVPVGEQTLGSLDCVGCQRIDLRVLRWFFVNLGGFGRGVWLAELWIWWKVSLLIQD